MIYPPVSEIEPLLYLGSLQGAKDKELLESIGIQCIVQVLDEIHLDSLYETMDYLFIPLADWTSSNIVMHLPNALKFIHQNISQDKKVFIHCAAGVSRSVSIVCAYLMAKYHISYDRALKEVRNRRWCALPNPGFARQLRNISLDALISYIDNP
ncbi:unnamed protein product [Blepharisma stoltei]|uniref:Dual specificity protein phosphatase n=1 Tax=Blepharisma stoltei TaxID=1481888 RepID=A0AAU9K721_9CILI|nr:unnamed protein product [Blepharisma stoltei]